MVLTYFGARYYDPEIGIWTATDPEEQHNNPFLYASNNHINRVDPDGKNDFFIFYDTEILNIAVDIGIVIDFKDPMQSGFFESPGEGFGGVFGGALGIGFTLGDVEGKSRNVDFNLFGGSTTLIFDKIKGWQGLTLNFGPGVGALGTESEGSSFTLQDMLDNILLLSSWVGKNSNYTPTTKIRPSRTLWPAILLCFDF